MPSIWRKGIALAAMGVLLLGAVATVAFSSTQEPSTAAPPASHPLVWDATEKTLTPKPGETMADFQFTVTNTSDKEVTIEQIRPTCGCTVAEMPSSPWVLGPHSSGTFTGAIDFRGKEGTEAKGLYVNSSAGTQVLRIVVKIPTVDEAGRRENQRIAQANRQAVFAGKCADCHREPAVERRGSELFIAACGVCHLAPRRASMVPDLLTARQHRDAEYWRHWIREGKDRTLMPAWAKDRGGPLTDEQVESLVEFAVRTLPSEPRPDAAR